MNTTEFTGWMEDLSNCSDEERFVLLKQAALDVDLGQRLREASLLLQAMGDRDAGRLTAEETALELARGRVCAAVLSDWRTLSWLMACLQEEAGPKAAVDPLRRTTRRAIKALVEPLPVHRRRMFFWMPATVLLVATAVLLAVFLLPAGEPGARALGLNRWRVWQLSPGLRADLEGAVREGTLAPPLFSRGPSLSRRERAARAVGQRPPRLLAPRWEAIEEMRPVFRWTDPAGQGAAFELLLLDAQRRLIWSGQGEEQPGERIYPADSPVLVPGATYYWKVNRHAGERLVASSYAAFTILDAARKRALAADLEAAGDLPFLKAMVYLHYGLYSAAAAALREAAGSQESPQVMRQVASRLLAEVLTRQGL